MAAAVVVDDDEAPRASNCRRTDDSDGDRFAKPVGPVDDVDDDSGDGDAGC